MNLLKEYELEKKRVITNHNNHNILELYEHDSNKGGNMYFFCGICEKKCYQDISSGLGFYKKIILNHNRTIDTKYSKYTRYDENNKTWMKVCFRCKYNNKLLGYCINCKEYYLKNTQTLKNSCVNKPKFYNSKLINL